MELEPSEIYRSGLLDFALRVSVNLKGGRALTPAEFAMWGNWVLDGYAGVSYYSMNPAFDAGPVSKPQTEDPIGSFEGHLSYDFKPGTWASLDGNF